MRAYQPCTWNIVLQYLTVRDGEGRPALYLEYGLAVRDGEGRPALYLEYSLAVRDGEGRPALYLEYCLAVSGSEMEGQTSPVPGI